MPATSDPVCSGAISIAVDDLSVALVAEGVPDDVLIKGAAVVERIDAFCALS